MPLRPKFLRRRHGRKPESGDVAPDPISSTGISPQLQRISSPSEDVALQSPRHRRNVEADPHPQLQSLFLTRLPIEIRLLIYERLLASAIRLHIVGRNGGKSLDYRECKYARGFDVFTHSPCLEPDPADGGKMGLLRSCKTIYVEAAPLLYSHNVFDHHALDSFLAFINVVPTQHLNYIRYLKLSMFWYAWFPHSSVEDLRKETCPARFKFEWKGACDTLAGMEGLQELRIEIGFSWENLRKAALTEGVWFEQLARVRRQRIRVFNVEVNWPAVDGKGEEVEAGDARLGVEEWPFRLSRMLVMTESE